MGGKSSRQPVDRGTFLYRAFQQYLAEVKRDHKKNRRLDHEIDALKALSDAHIGQQRSDDDFHIPLLTVIFQSAEVSPELLWGFSVMIVKLSLIGLLETPVEQALREARVHYMPGSTLKERLDTYRYTPSQKTPSDAQAAFLNTTKSVVMGAMVALTAQQHLSSKIEPYQQELSEALAGKRPKSGGNGPV